MANDPAGVRSDPWPVAVVGAGAAGIVAAIFAARAGSRVALIETRPVPGAKIRVSGGGRCNVLPSRLDLADFDTAGSRHTLRNVLLSWPLDDVRRFFEVELELPLKVESTGKVFPVSDRSQDVVQALLRECARAGVTLLAGRKVAGAAPLDVEGGTVFRLEAENAPPLDCRRLVLATGGLSLPKTGSDGSGLAIARALGHTLRETHPALVPLLAKDAAWGDLAGVSLRARLEAVEGGSGNARASACILEEREGDFLFTHRGFSGPVVLDLSRHFTRPGGESVRLFAAWGGAAAPPWDEMLRPPVRRSVAGILRQHLSRRLADRLLKVAMVPEDRATSELRREERVRLVEVLTACPLEVAGSEGYRTAEVTAGGIPLEEVSPRTLESRIAPGLHLCGEMLDAVGHIGGYNFLWAWVTGRRAGEGAAGAVSEM